MRGIAGIVDPDPSSAARRGAANFVKLITGQVATLGVLTVSGFLVPRLLGAETYGQYAAAMAVTAILQAASSLGLQQVGLRYLAPLGRSPESSQAVDLASSLWTIRLILSLVAATLAVVWLTLSPKLGLGFWVCFLLGLLCLLRSALQATQSLFLPLGHAGKTAIFNFLRASLTLAVVVLAFLKFGLTGIFATLPGLYALLFSASAAVLFKIIPLRPTRLRWPVLRPYLGYSLATFLGMMATMIHAHLSVYVVASWVTRREAGFLAVILQLYSLARDLFLAARRSLMPILAELEEDGQTERLRQWGGLILRYGAAASCMAAVAWALVGKIAVSWLLTDAFAPVYAGAAAIFIAVIFFCCGASCIGLLYIRGRAGVAAANTVLYAAVTVVGLVLCVLDGTPGVVYRISWVYALAAAVHWMSSYVSLGIYGGIWLPLPRVLLLILPAALTWPATAWDASALPRLAALAAFVLAYAGLATLLGLLPVREIREILRTLRTSTPSEK